MEIPINAGVKCEDGPCGQSTYVIIDPTEEQVTHLVVQEQEAPHTERLVPIELVLGTTPQGIRLRCNRDVLNSQDPFKIQEFVRSTVPHYQGDAFMAWPFAVPETRTELLEHESVPPGELVARRGMTVQATDGTVGEVDQFLVDPDNGCITHLVLRNGLLWNKKEIVLPISVIDHIEEGVVHLKLDKHSVQVLPDVPIKR
jgi:sporulation protein YlmC with PRC-barrel domain